MIHRLAGLEKHRFQIEIALNASHYVIGKDTLVGWAWKPGFGRAPAPGTQAQAGALVEAWVKTGAACPAQ